MEEKVRAFLQLATEKKASDIFIIAGRPLSVKIDGKLCTLEGFEERLMPPETDEFIRIIYKLAHDRNIQPMLESGDDDFSMAIPGLSRFRVNTYRQRGSLAAVIRIIAFNLPDPQDLHIPPAVMEAADLTKGMVLITGPAGSGKSTTMACIIDQINHSREYASIFSGVRSSMLTVVCVAFARADTTASNVSFSCAAYPLTVLTRFGLRSARRWYWFSTLLQAVPTASSCDTIELYEETP